MTRATLPPYSMLAATPLYESDHLVVPGLVVSPVVAADSDSAYVVVQAVENRLDLISTAFYGVPNLWWVIAAVNNLVDPLADVMTGTTLRIPDKARLARDGLLTV